VIGEPTPPPIPAFGSIAGTSTPPGANVYLDNAYKGFTPLTFDAVVNGNHVIIIRLDGYEEASHMIVMRGNQQTVNVSMGHLNPR
jgi:hypothetical protein